MPQVDNGEALNMSGTVVAASVELHNRETSRAQDKNGHTVVHTEKIYRVTVTLETTDATAVEKLVMVRMRQNSTKTADLIVWPAT